MANGPDAQTRANRAVKERRRTGAEESVSSPKETATHGLFH